MSSGNARNDFVSALTTCINQTLLVSNVRSRLIDQLNAFLGRLFHCYSIYIAKEYNLVFRLEGTCAPEGLCRKKCTAWLPDTGHTAALDLQFLESNLKVKGGNDLRDVYISTLLFKRLMEQDIYFIQPNRSAALRYCFELPKQTCLHYLVPLRSKHSLLGFLVVGHPLKMMTGADALSNLLLLQSALSSVVENHHVYKDFDIKINEFMKLKDSNEMIIESIEMGIIVVEDKNKIRAINRKACEILDVDHTISDQQFTRLIHERFHNNLLEFIRTRLPGSESAIKLFDQEYSSQDTHKRIDIVISPYRDIANKITGFIMIIDDITERKKYEERLMRQEKLASLGQLVAGVAHEINTPLTGIRSYSQLLKERLPRLEKQQQQAYLDKIIKQVDRCSRIIDELLSFARRKKANKIYFNINGLVKGLTSIAKTLVKGKNIQLQLDLPANDVVVFADKGKIEQVLLNLMVNSKDAIDGSGRILLKVEDQHNKVRITVRDTGKGIPDEDIGRIFEPFFTTKHGTGTGLGLSLSYGIIKEHNGEIKVSSKPGKGTSFYITLPKG